MEPEKWRLSWEEDQEIARHYAEDMIEDEMPFAYDEVKLVEPKILDLVEQGDMDGLQNFLLKVGGF